MLLINLKHYVKNQRFVSLFDLTTRFDLEPDILRAMLQLLIRKGSVRQRHKTNHCGVKCLKCDPKVTEIYEWID
jgi:hypothetical protein